MRLILDLMRYSIPWTHEVKLALVGVIERYK